MTFNEWWEDVYKRQAQHIVNKDVIEGRDMIELAKKEEIALACSFWFKHFAYIL